MIKVNDTVYDVITMNLFKIAKSFRDYRLKRIDVLIIFDVTIMCIDCRMF